MDQWKGYCKDGFLEKGWVIVDGILMCKVFGQGEVGGGGDIIIKEIFGNFELKLEWKIFEGGNSGIFYLVCEKCGEDGQLIWKFFFEMQVFDNEKYFDVCFGKDGNCQVGFFYDFILVKFQNVVFVGGWNEVMILFYDGIVVYMQNGENVVEYYFWIEDWKEMVANSKFKDY